VGLRPLACWDYRFESRRQHACLSVVIVMFCQVEVSASGCGVSEYDRKTSTVRRSRVTRRGGFCAMGKLLNLSVTIYISLTVHLGIILVNNQIDPLFFQCIYLFPFSTCFKQPSTHHQENRILSVHHLVYVTLCR
jgi:hypothetical protein